MTVQREQFWEIIGESRSHFRTDRPDSNMDGQLASLRDLLLMLPEGDVQSFNDQMHSLMVDAYRWDLWGAAAILSGGSCSDDNFTDFCSWLISMGQRTYERALAEPDSLAAIVKDPTIEDFFFEEFQHVPAQVYEEMTGKEAPAFTTAYGAHPSGEKTWASAEQLRVRYPRLWAAMKDER